jgi:hypothetical protein
LKTCNFLEVYEHLWISEQFTTSQDVKIFEILCFLLILRTFLDLVNIFFTSQTIVWTVWICLRLANIFDTSLIYFLIIWIFLNLVSNYVKLTNYFFNRTNILSLANIFKTSFLSNSMHIFEYREQFLNIMNNFLANKKIHCTNISKGREHFLILVIFRNCMNKFWITRTFFLKKYANKIERYEHF